MAFDLFQLAESVFGIVSAVSVAILVLLNEINNQFIYCVVFCVIQLVFKLNQVYLDVIVNHVNVQKKTVHKCTMGFNASNGLFRCD